MKIEKDIDIKKKEDGEMNINKNQMIEEEKEEIIEVKDMDSNYENDPVPEGNEEDIDFKNTNV